MIKENESCDDVSSTTSSISRTCAPLCSSSEPLLINYCGLPAVRLQTHSSVNCLPTVQLNRFYLNSKIVLSIGLIRAKNHWSVRSYITSEDASDEAASLPTKGTFTSSPWIRNAVPAAQSWTLWSFYGPESTSNFETIAIIRLQGI
jgi:hypothetical protein